MLKNPKDFNKNVLSILLMFYAAMMPFEEIFAFSFGSLLRVIAVVTIGFAILLAIKQKYIRFVSYWNWLFLWFVLSVGSALWADSLYWWGYFLQIYAFQFLFAFIIVNTSTKYIDLNKMKYGLILGAAVASVLLIVSPSMSMNTADGRRTIILLGHKMDPNILASIIAIAFYALLSVYNRELKNIYYKIAHYGIMTLLFVGIILTGSRGVVIALGLSIIILVALMLLRNQQRKTALYVIFGGIALLVLIRVVLPENLLTARFSINTILGFNEYEGGVHNRYTIWLHAWELFIKRPVLGYGCGNFFYNISLVYKQCAAHNLIVLEMVEMGAIGAMPVFIFLYKLLKKSYQHTDLITFSMLVLVYIIALSLDTLPYKYFWVVVVLVTHTIKKNTVKEGV